MPLPSNPLTITGGCNCQAVRYKIEVPALSDRPLNTSSSKDVSYPMVCTDHCNDCRRAVASILPTWMCVPASMFSCDLRPKSHVDYEDPFSQERWIPGAELFWPGSKSDKYWLQFYKSSFDVTRTFCGQCGTNLTFARKPMPEGWLDIFDVLVGSMDREFVEKDWMAPDRHCWVGCEIDWVKTLTSGGKKLPRHPRSQLNELASAD